MVRRLMNNIVLKSNKVDISANIKAIRHVKGISQAEIARRLDVEPPSYHRLENRGKKLSIEQLEEIASALGVSLLELLTWEEDKADTTAESSDVGQLKKRVKELEKLVDLHERYAESVNNRYDTLNEYFPTYLDNMVFDLLIEQKEKELDRPLTEEEYENAEHYPIMGYVKEDYDWVWDWCDKYFPHYYQLCILLVELGILSTNQANIRDGLLRSKIRIENAHRAKSLGLKPGDETPPF
jgi:transcriptional regulator with XRE-family HTH domain